LKNRPNPHKWFYRKQVDEWFVGFEKELREIYKLERKIMRIRSWELIQEILGE
jgi:hypothetical protein